MKKNFVQDPGDQTPPPPDDGGMPDDGFGPPEGTEGSDDD